VVVTWGRLIWLDRDGLGVERLHIFEGAPLVAVLRQPQVEPNAEAQLLETRM